jgi:hypothetical protein
VRRPESADVTDVRFDHRDGDRGIGLSASNKSMVRLLMMELNTLRDQPADRLLRLFAETLEELRRRDLVRSSNNPVADYAEKIAGHALGLRLIGKSGAGHDGEDLAGNRYQVKGRRVTPHNESRQLSYMRNLDTKPFDYLVGIIFDAEFRVHRACVAPFDVVQSLAAFSKHVNAHRLVLRDEFWDQPGVRDVTTELAEAAKAVCMGASGR